MTIHERIRSTLADLAVFAILVSGAVFVIGYFLGIWSDAPIW